VSDENTGLVYTVTHSPEWWKHRTNYPHNPD